MSHLSQNTQYHCFCQYKIYHVKNKSPPRRSNTTQLSLRFYHNHSMKPFSNFDNEIANKARNLKLYRTPRKAQTIFKISSYLISLGSIETRNGLPHEIFCVQRKCLGSIEVYTTRAPSPYKWGDDRQKQSNHLWFMPLSHTMCPSTPTNQVQLHLKL